MRCYEGVRRRREGAGVRRMEQSRPALDLGQQERGACGARHFRKTKHHGDGEANGGGVGKGHLRQLQGCTQDGCIF